MDKTMTANLELCKLILDSLPLHGDKPNRSLALQMYGMYIAKVPGRELWRRQAFDMSEPNLCANLLIEVAACCYVEAPTPARLNKVSEAIKAAMSQEDGPALCLLALTSSCEHINTSYSGNKEEGVKLTLTLLYIAVLIALLIYADLQVKEKSDNALYVPLLSGSRIAFMPFRFDLPEDKTQFLSRLTALELLTMYGVLSLKGMTDITPEQVADMIDDKRLLIGAGLKYSWMLLYMTQEYEHFKQEAKSQKLTECLKFVHNAAELGKTYSAVLVQLFCASVPTTPCAADSIDEAKTNRKYLLWQGLTRVDWNEKNLRRVYLQYSGERKMILTLMYADCKSEGISKNNVNQMMSMLKIVGDLPMQCSVFLPPMDLEDAWLDVRKKYVVEAKMIPGGAPNECGIPAEAIRMCVVPKERKITGNRVPTGSVKADRAPKKSDVAVTYVPRIEYVVEHDASEHQETGRHYGTGTPKAAYMVAGFIRQIPEAWKTSDDAKERAKEAGMELPIGYTYVRPHVRGHGDPKNIKNVKVRR